MHTSDPYSPSHTPHDHAPAGMDFLAQLQDFREELQHPPERLISYDRRDFLPVIGAFGVAGTSEWRDNMNVLFKLLCQKFRIVHSASEIFFNPQRPVSTWQPEYADTEASHLSRDAILVFGIEKNIPSIGSMAEIGFIALFSLLKAKKVFVFAEEAEPDLGEDVKRVRDMFLIDIQHLASILPESFFRMEHPIDAMEASFRERIKFLSFLAAPIHRQTTELLHPSTDIVERVCISGTSREQYTVDKLTLMTRLRTEMIDLHDTYDPHWSINRYEKEELPVKDASRVNVVLISHTRSYGAVKDVGLAIFRAIAHGTYAVIRFPEDTDPESDYSRARALVMTHWQRLCEEFSFVRHYVKFADTLDEVSEYTSAIMRTHRPKKQP